MTPEKLRAIANALDYLDELASLSIKLIRSGDAANMTDLEGSDELLEWLHGDEMQKDLRDWADELEEAG